MTISLIVAVSQNGVIGIDNKLPWHLPMDLERFKEITMGHPIIMGRKTFAAIGKPLPGRTNIVITRQKDFACCDRGATAKRSEEIVARSERADCGVLTAESLEKALELCDHRATAQRSKEMVALPLSADHADEQEVFVIGGATIFEQALPLADKLYLTLIHQDFDGDTFFKWDKTKWKQVSRENQPDPIPFSFILLKKR